MRRLLRFHSPKLALAFKCLSIGANALCAGGVFILPLLSPTLVAQFKFTQLQVTTIVLAGIVGQYPLAPIVGRIIDRHGPQICSLLAAIAYTLAFGGFAFEISRVSHGISGTPLSSFHFLVFCSLLTGFGTVFSYYSSLFAASKTFPRYIGIASGTSMAFFGLSPMFLTIIGSKFFTDPLGSLDPAKYMLFLAALTGVVHLVGTVALKRRKDDTLFQRDQTEIDENTALLPETSDPSKSQAARIPKTSFPMKNPSFWLLAFLTLFTLGAAEMVISNIGTIVVALPSEAEGTLSILSSSTAQQVQLLSISNTAVRVITGFIADIISPAALPVNGTASLRQKRFISRIFFLSWPTLFLALTFLLVPYIVKTQADAWILSVGVGTSYGAIFAIMPSIVSAIWGMENLGRNFGILMTAPLVGTSLFSYLYAFVSQSHTAADGVCAGRLCWLLTFQIGAATSFVSFALTVVLWFRWRGLL